MAKNSTVRTLWLELAGAVGLALMAPAVLIGHSNEMGAKAWGIWGLTAALNGLGALYVRLRVADTHHRKMGRAPMFVAHLVVLMLVALAVWRWDGSWWLLLPYAGIFLRAVWTLIQPRPIANIKQFGFTEIGVALLCGAGVVLGF